MKAYKLFRQRGGKLFPLFINRRTETVIGRWLEAEDHKTKGYAHRPGWHSGFRPIAPHLMRKDGSMMPGRCWTICEVPDDSTIYTRPGKQGGKWIISQRIKVVAVLTAEEVDAINREG